MNVWLGLCFTGVDAVPAAGDSGLSEIAIPTSGRCCLDPGSSSLYHEIIVLFLFLILN